MHFPLCTHLSDSYQHCFCADIAFVYLLLSDVCRIVGDAVVALKTRVSWNVWCSPMEMFYFKWIIERFVLEWPCHGGEILLIFRHAWKWMLIMRTPSVVICASTAIIKTICLEFYVCHMMMMISTVATRSYWNPMILLFFFLLLLLAGNHMEISFGT